MRPGTFLALALAVTGASACVRSNVVTCGDAAVCAEGLVCATVQDQDRCVTQDQIDACTNETCGVEPAVAAVCHDGVCFETGCGNRLVDPGEVCDDGNAIIGDDCSSQCTSDETCGNGIVDLLLPTGDEACDDGNLYSHDGCAPGCIAETAVWQRATPLVVPDGRINAAMVYDALRDRLVMFGGATFERGPGQPQGDLWESDRGGWAEVERERGPRARRGHAMAYDPVRQRTVMFGGRGATLLDDTWEWDGAAWTTPQVTGERPAARSGHAMAYVPARATVVMVGSSEVADGSMSDTVWEWDGTAWTRMAGVVPTEIFEARLAVDATTGDGVLAATIYDATLGETTVQTWHLTASGWDLRAQTPSPPTSSDDLPPESSLAWDPISRRIIAYGSGTDPVQQGTRAWDGARWTRLVNATEPGQRHEHVMATHGGLGAVVLLGGHDRDELNSMCTTCPALTPTAWRFTGTGWVPLARAAPVPSTHSAVAFDARRDRVLLLGGYRIDANRINESWLLDSALGWTDAGIPFAEPRAGLALAYDDARDEAIGFGGSFKPPTTDEVVLDETYRWSTTTGWDDVAVVGGRPPARVEAAMAYDSNRSRVLLFGGTTGPGPDDELGDLWQWDGDESRWTMLAPAGPPPRAASAMGYDPVHDQLVVMGGVENGRPLDDTWTWDGTSWTRAASVIAARYRATIAWDAARRALILHGGFAEPERALGDTWEWSGSAWRAVAAIDPPPRRGAHVAWTASDGGIYVYGGADMDIASALPAVVSGERFWFRFTTGAPSEVCSAGTDADQDGDAGCADADCWGTCTPRCSPGLSCPADAPRCGDLVCEDPLENCAVCPDDCGACPTLCGDGRCTDGETCPGDCGA